MLLARAEQRLSQAVRAVPEGVYDGGPEWQEALSSLDWLLGSLLLATNPEWGDEVTDGIQPFIGRKAKIGALEVFGWVWFLPNGLPALYVRLQVAEEKDEVIWLECYLGEWDEDRASRKEYRSQEAARKSLYPREPDQVDWYYHLTFGERRP